MGRLRFKKRKHQIKIKQLRKKKLAKLRLAYTKAKVESEKKAILEKVFKITPWLSKEEFLKPVKSKTSKSEKN